MQTEMSTGLGPNRLVFTGKHRAISHWQALTGQDWGLLFPARLPLGT